MTRFRPCLGCGQLFPVEIGASRCATCRGQRRRSIDRARTIREPWRKIYRTIEWLKAKRQALARSAEQNDGVPICEMRGCVETRKLEVHHLVPLSEGGQPYELENLVVLCPGHHHDIERELRRARLAAAREQA